MPEDHAPLHKGARISSHEVVLAHLHHDAAGVNAKDLHGRTPLYIAACETGKPGGARGGGPPAEGRGVDETIVATDRRNPAHVVGLGV